MKNVTTPATWTQTTATGSLPAGMTVIEPNSVAVGGLVEADDVRGPRRRHQRARHGHGRHRRVHDAGHRRDGRDRADRSDRARPQGPQGPAGADGAPGAPVPGRSGRPRVRAVPPVPPARRRTRSSGENGRVGSPDGPVATCGTPRRCASCAARATSGGASRSRFGNRTVTRGRLVTCGSNPRPIVGARIDVVHVLPGNKRRRKTGLRSRANGRADADPADRPAHPHDRVLLPPGPALDAGHLARDAAPDGAQQPRPHPALGGGADTQRTDLRALLQEGPQSLQDVVDVLVADRQRRQQAQRGGAGRVERRGAGRAARGARARARRRRRSRRPA